MYLQENEIETGARHFCYNDNFCIHILVTIKGTYERQCLLVSTVLSEFEASVDK